MFGTSHSATPFSMLLLSPLFISLAFISITENHLIKLHIKWTIRTEKRIPTLKIDVNSQ
jgi:hypothetical protein